MPIEERPPGDRLLTVSTTALLATFVALGLRAMWLYPGGTWRDPTTTGYRLFENYFCDLASDIAANGAQNPGAPFGKLAMMLFAAALVPFFRQASRLAPSIRGAQVTWRCCCTGAVFTAMVPWTSFGPLHSAVSLLPGGSGLVATLLLLDILRRRRAFGLFALGLAVLASSSVVAVVYTAVITLQATPVVLPAAQKVACACLMLWMGAIVWRRPTA